MRELFRLRAQLYPDYRLQSFLTSRRTDASLELRCTQPVKKAAIHGSAIESAKRAAVGVRKNGFGAGLRDHPAEPARDFVERFLPGDALKRLQSGSARPARALGRAFFSPHGVEDAVWRIDAIQVLCDLGAKKSARHRVRGIALNLGCAAVFNGDQDATSVGAIVRTSSVHRGRHLRIIGSMNRGCTEANYFGTRLSFSFAKIVHLPFLSFCSSSHCHVSFSSDQRKVVWNGPSG